MKMALQIHIKIEINQGMKFSCAVSCELQSNSVQFTKQSAGKFKNNL